MEIDSESKECVLDSRSLCLFHSRIDQEFLCWSQQTQVFRQKDVSGLESDKISLSAERMDMIKNVWILRFS